MSEAPQAGKIRIGISGWRYARWRGQFYPKGLAQRRESESASKTFSSVEINGTFYSLQRPSSFQRWTSETPSDFVFAVKGGRFITHMKKLDGAETALANFCVKSIGPWGETRILRLATPADDGMQRGRLRRGTLWELLQAASAYVPSAVRLAERCDERMLARAFLKPTLKRVKIRSCGVQLRLGMIRLFSLPLSNC